MCLPLWELLEHAAVLAMWLWRLPWMWKQNYDTESPLGYGRL